MSDVIAFWNSLIDNSVLLLVLLLLVLSLAAAA